MNHPLQRQEQEDASLFASPFSPMERQLINNARYARGDAQQTTALVGMAQTNKNNNIEGQHQQNVMSQLSQQSQQQQRMLQHANTMPYPVNNIESTANNTAAPIIGPRGKCDQVIYEAMTKACEIVVRGRCTQLDLNERRIMFQQQQQQQQQGGVNARGYSDGMIPSSTANNHNSSSSSRFNIQVEEVPSVRSILQTWKRALNIPLRLDIFYEYADDTTNGGGVQRELLERWCIDYKNVNVPLTSSSKVMTGATKSSSSSSSSTMNSNINSSVSQLRLVCKRIVVLLRNLHCMTRMLPAYRLQSLIDNSANVDGVFGMIPTNNNGTSGMGIIGYSIYASDYEPNGPTLPSPSFTQQAFPSVKTPFGNLAVSVMYDATLNPHEMVEGIMDRLRSEEDVWAQHQPQQRRQEEDVGEYQQQFDTTDMDDATALRSSTPIPVPPETIPTPGQSHVHNSAALQAQQGRGDGGREFGSCPPTLLRGRSRSSSLGGLSATGGRSRAVSDLIITDYHSSPAIRPMASPAVGSVSGGGNEKRIMSGLSLAMMADENSSQQQQQYPAAGGGMPLTPDEYSEQDDSLMQHQWGSLATRAAFHHPPPTYESPGVTDDINDPAGGATNNFFQYHGGYGYGYNGSQVQLNSEEPQTPFPPVGSAGSRVTNDGLSMSPSPLMSTPPPHYSSWMKRRQSAAGSTTPSSLKENLGDTQNSDQVDDDEDAPPFTNPTVLQPLPSSTLSAVPTSPSTYANRQLEHASSSVGNSPQHQEFRNDSQRRQSSSSVLLPPMTSLDLLQKSPFTAKGGGDGTSKDADSLAMPFTLGSYRDEMFMSSIPKLVAAGSKSRTSSLAGSNSQTNPFMASFGQSSAGGYYSTGPFASRREIHGCSQSDAADEAEEMPFALALDEDSPFAKSSSGRSLLGSTRGDHSGLASSSLAVSSLHQRCDQGKPRLKMFSRSRTRSSGISNDEETKADKDSSTAADYYSIKDQLSEFRTWHSSSLMVDSGASK